MRILYAGDIVGSPGRKAFTELVPRLREELQLNAVIVNGENAAGGRGITPHIADSLFKAGADAITLGDHAWDQRDIYPYIDQEPRLIRPANFTNDCPGKGITTIEVPAGPITILQVMGRVFMQPVASCPFRKADSLLKKMGTKTGVILAEIHAEATSEKIAFGRYLEGRVSAVVGTHTHVQTSDQAVLPEGTAYLTDLGMTGPKDSVLGREVEPVLKKFLTGLPTKFDVAKNQVALEGAIIEVDNQSGKATGITTLRHPLEAS